MLDPDRTPGWMPRWRDDRAALRSWRFLAFALLTAPLLLGAAWIVARTGPTLPPSAPRWALVTATVPLALATAGYLVFLLRWGWQVSAFERLGIGAVALLLGAFAGHALGAGVEWQPGGVPGLAGELEAVSRTLAAYHAVYRGWNFVAALLVGSAAGVLWAEVLWPLCLPAGRRR